MLEISIEWVKNGTYPQRDFIYTDKIYSSIRTKSMYLLIMGRSVLPETKIICHSTGLTDIGLLRSNNEDMFAILPEQQFYVLADGMGGQAAGEVAAHMAVSSLCAWVQKYNYTPGTSADDLLFALEQAIANTNTEIYQKSSLEKEMAGMGTTMCLAWVVDNYLLISHIGDSRIYRVRDNALLCLTQDHSLHEELLAQGETSQSIKKKYKHIITRALGTQRFVLPEIQVHTAQPGDLYFLCSDGISDYATPSQMLEITQKNSSLKEMAEAFILSAKQAGSVDNLTVLFVQISDVAL